MTYFKPTHSRPYGADFQPAAGFTLVEILAAMFVLAVGLASVASIVLSSTRAASAAADRNNAAVIVPEALADIERMMLINSNTGLDPSKFPLGQLMDTLNIGAGGPFDGVTIVAPNPSGTGASTTFSFGQLACVACKNKVGLQNVAYWPFDTKRSRVMGQYPLAGTVNPLFSVTGSGGGSTGLGYRGLFKLQPHPDWLTNNNPRTYNNASIYVGVYILTFALYRDLDPGKATTDPTKRLSQVTDPVIKYLKDKVVR